METCNEKKSFWRLLNELSIEIPIIQRDYAQGRSGNEYLRENFLACLKNALDTGIVLRLDFVYGKVDDNKMLPLDGQQRLTTLWLLHWYIALMAGKLEFSVCKILKRFTYETRISSREFCEQLCNPENFRGYKRYGITDFITNSTWFYSAWKYDPTIQSILQMLGGATGIGEIVDGIEKLFHGAGKDEFELYWNDLTSDNSPIVFYYLKLEDFGLSDDLYIKMNARGKPLTTFENFKADLVGYIKEKSEISKDIEWKKLLDAQNGIPKKMDTDWTDVFWNGDGKYDEAYFAFLNRYFLNNVIIYMNVKEGNDVFYSLYGNQSDDSILSYNGFNIYKKILEGIQGNLPVFQNLEKLFNNLKSIRDINRVINDCLPVWFNGEEERRFRFIPEFERDKDGKFVLIKDASEKQIYKVTTLTQPQRVLFYAVCRYLETNVFHEMQFRRWMRIVCNLIENTMIDTIDSMVGRMKLIHELSEHCNEIYSYLMKINGEIKSSASKEQLKEEIEKVKQILDEKGDLRKYDGNLMKENDSCYGTWEELIVDAENYAFFRGAIRFLFKDENNNIDWGLFPVKIKNAKLIFNRNGLSDNYRNEALANRIILSYCNSWSDQIESWTHHDKYIFGFSSEIWRENILLKKGNADYTLLYAKPIHCLLTGNGININPALSEPDININEAFSKLVKTNIIERAKEIKNTDWNYVRRIYEGLCLYPSSEGIILTNSFRDKIINDLIDKDIIKLIHGKKIKTTSEAMLYGWNISFTYTKNGVPYLFHWQYWGWIDMYEGGRRLCQNEEFNNLTIDSRNIKSTDDLVREMDNCVEEYDRIINDNKKKTDYLSTM